MISEYSLKRRVEFAETDAAGIVHFSNYFRYMEMAEHAMWRSAGLSIHADDTQFGWPRVSASFEYHKPLAFEDEFEVHLRVTKKTKKTISYTATVTRGDDTIAVGQLTVACVRMVPGEAMKAVPLPPEIDRLIQIAPAGEPA